MVTAKHKEEAEKFSQNFIDKIKEEMKKQNVSLSEFSDYLGCTPKHALRLFQQKKVLTANKLVDMAAALGYKISIAFEK